MQHKASAVLFLIVTTAACVSSLGTKTVKVPVIMFDDSDYSGGAQNFPVVLPANGCSDCENLVRTCKIVRCNLKLRLVLLLDSEKQLPRTADRDASLTVWHIALNVHVPVVCCVLSSMRK